MARWRVTAKHYINARQFGEDTTWVREETNRDTGRAFRRTFLVPLYIDPEDPISINKNVGFCVVATEGSEMPGDIILDGPPTPDMEPMDVAAEAITAECAKKWNDPINSLPVAIGEDFGQKLLGMLTSQFNSVNAAPNTSLKGAATAEIDELKQMLVAQAKQIEMLMAGGAASVEPLADIDLEAPTLPLTAPPAKAPSARRA